MDPLFQVHRLNEKGLAAAASVANAFDDLLEVLLVLIPVNGRELALVRTKLEEACFFAKKAIANRPENQASEQEQN